MLRALALACLLASPAAAETLRLQGGTPTTIGGHTLTLMHVEDQRCPPDVDCFWEGLIRLTLTLSLDAGQGPPEDLIVLCNRCEGATLEATAAGMTLSLQGLEPSTADLAALGRPVRVADYTAVVTVATAP